MVQLLERRVNFTFSSKLYIGEMILILFESCLLLLLFLRIVYFIILKECKSNSCLVGKTAIVTGGNRGIGYQISLGLASRGCRLIIACRSTDDFVKNEITKYTGNSNIILKHLDLSSFASIRKFAKEIRETEDHIDILIHNAGVSGPNCLSEDGLNFIAQVNHYGPFLLTHLLLDVLKKSAQSRVIFVSSVLAYVHSPFLKNLNESSSMLFIYNNAKAFTTATSKIMAEKLKDFGITVNVAEPGVVFTDIFTGIGAGFVYKKFLTVLIIFFLCFLIRTPRQAAQNIIKVAVSYKLRNVTGKFFSNCSEFPEPILARNRKFCEHAWKNSEKWSGLRLEEKIKDTWYADDVK